MEVSYNIIWLDDWFADIDEPNITDLERLKRRKFQETDVTTAYEMGFKVKGITSYSEFEEELKNISSYEAVVLDIAGMKNEFGEVENDTCMHVIDLLKDEQIKLPLYFYSASDEHPDITTYINKYKKDGKVFKKTSGPEYLLTNIRDDLNKHYHHYLKHEECLKLFTEHYLSSDRGQREVMDKIIQRSGDHNDMRKILEGMFETLKDVGLIAYEGSLADKEPFNSCVNYLATKCPPLPESMQVDSKKGKRDWDHPTVSFRDCNQETKYLISFLGNVVNFNSHFITKKDCESYLGLYYDNNFKDATYGAFYAIMKWFYSFMKKNF